MSVPVGVDQLFARRSGDHVYLATVDGGFKLEVQPTDGLPFDKIANDPRIAFVRTGNNWKPQVRDPRHWD
jgi:hypothetical protein